jgi:hypothetical protein
MFTQLYSAVFNKIVQRNLGRWLTCSVGSHYTDAAQREEVIKLNRSVYEEKLPEALAVANQRLKKKIPWLNAAFLLYLVAAITCMATLNKAPESKSFLVTTMISGGVAISILFWMLGKFSGVLNSFAEEAINNSPASFMVFQLPLFVLQMMLVFAMLMSGILTLKFMPCISGISLLILALFTQYRAVHMFVERFESQELDNGLFRHFMMATSSLYSRSIKGKILTDAMEGQIYTIKSLQALQGVTGVHASSDMDDLLAL